VYAPPQSYQQSDVLSAPPGRLVVLLYDGAGRFLRQAAAAYDKGDGDRAQRALTRAEAIIDELNLTLDMSAGEVAEQLRDLYLFCRSHLGEARGERDSARVLEVAALLGELRTSWAQIAGQG